MSPKDGGNGDNPTKSAARSKKRRSPSEARALILARRARFVSVAVASVGLLGSLEACDDSGSRAATEPAPHPVGSGTGSAASGNTGVETSGSAVPQVSASNQPTTAASAAASANADVGDAGTTDAGLKVGIKDKDDDGEGGTKDKPDAGAPPPPPPPPKPRICLRRAPPRKCLSAPRVCLMIVGPVDRRPPPPPPREVPLQGTLDDDDDTRNA